MGLDMYLDKWPKLGMRPKLMSAIESLWELEERGKAYSLKDWCGVDESELPVKEVIELCKKFRHESYPAWDVEKKYPSFGMHDQVGYWRKANAIHRWIEDNVVNDGEHLHELQNCEYYHITEDDIKRLRDACKTVLDNTKLVEGKVKNGEVYENGKWKPVWEVGLVVDDVDICEELLPTKEGFFFGGVQYNEWYIADVRHTFELCNQVLEETDFSQYELTYLASW